MALQVPRAKRLAPASTAVISGTATARFKAKPVTFAELAKAALEYSKAHKSDHQRDDSRMKPVLETFRNRPADAITPQELERWLAHEADENDWSPATVNRYKALFSLTFRIGVENGHIKVQSHSIGEASPRGQHSCSLASVSRGKAVTNGLTNRRG